MPLGSRLPFSDGFCRTADLFRNVIAEMNLEIVQEKKMVFLIPFSDGSAVSFLLSLRYILLYICSLHGYRSLCCFIAGDITSIIGNPTNYDQEGNLCTEYDVREDLGTETITTRYFYDLSGRLAYCRNDRDEDYRYTYDQNNRVTKIENGNQFRKTETVYTYDKDGREKTAKAAAKTRQTAAYG